MANRDTLRGVGTENRNLATAACNMTLTTVTEITRDPYGYERRQARETRHKAFLDRPRWN